MERLFNVLVKYNREPKLNGPRYRGPFILTCLNVKVNSILGFEVVEFSLTGRVRLEVDFTLCSRVPPPDFYFVLQITGADMRHYLQFTVGHDDDD